MKRMKLTVVGVALFLLCPSLGTAGGPKVTKLNGYLEWRHGDALIVDGQRVVANAQTEFKGKGDASSIASIPLGYECKAEGARQRDGTILARKIEAKPNGMAMFEGEIKMTTDQLEAEFRRRGMVGAASAQARDGSTGRLYESGPQVERVRRIMRSLAPPYLSPDNIRVYVVESPEWNAFAMGNFSVYVYTGLLNDLNDDEVAIVLGHELVHATHEHSRRHFKRSLWIQLAAAGAAVAAEEIDSKTERMIVQIASGLVASAFSSGYGRNLEDQADRVGLRYVHEAGYDVTKGPALWRRFAQKYGDQDKVVNFFFGDHSRSARRAELLQRELALNYPEAAKRHTVR